MLQCVAACCSVFQCVVVYCCVSVAGKEVCCNVLQCVAVCCSVLQLLCTFSSELTFEKFKQRQWLPRRLKMTNQCKLHA